MSRDPSGADASPPALALVRELCAALDADAIVYCHWKSNAFLDRSLTGENDLDLLIRRADSGRFSGALHRLGFKAVADPARGLPGVASFYGHDAGTGRLVHVHAHYQLIVGDDLTKNYRIPLEEAFLASGFRDGGVPVPARELEYALLVIRLVLKHKTWDAVAARRGPMGRSARAELAFLQERIDDRRLDDVIRSSLPFVPPEVVRGCARALSSEASMLAGVRAGRRLTSALRPYARRSRPADLRLKLWRRVRRSGRLAGGPRPRKRLSAGGAMIAIVGADGAGKSTAVAALDDWLGRTFAVSRAHLGRPPRSRASSAVRGVVLASAVVNRLAGRGPAGATGRAPLTSRQRAILAVALARDRYLAFREGRRRAINGELVVCDRFPLAELTLMDAPRVDRMRGDAPRDRLWRTLAALERRYYDRLWPDLLIVLRVDPEIAVARKPDEPAEFVRARQQEIWGKDWTGTGARIVDAGRPQDEVLAEIKSIIWSEV